MPVGVDHTPQLGPGLALQSRGVLGFEPGLALQSRGVLGFEPYAPARARPGPSVKGCAWV